MLIWKNHKHKIFNLRIKIQILHQKALGSKKIQHVVIMLIFLHGLSWIFPFSAWLIMNGGFHLKRFHHATQKQYFRLFSSLLVFTANRKKKLFKSHSRIAVNNFFCINQEKKFWFCYLLTKKTLFSNKKVKKKRFSILFQQATLWQSFCSICKIKWVLTFKNQTISSFVLKGSLIFTFGGKKKNSAILRLGSKLVLCLHFWKGVSPTAGRFFKNEKPHDGKKKNTMS